MLTRARGSNCALLRWRCSYRQSGEHEAALYFFLQCLVGIGETTQFAYLPEVRACAASDSRATAGMRVPSA